MMSSTPLSVWIGFIIFVLFLLGLDLGVFNKKDHEVGFKESILWSLFWILLSLVFGAGIFYFKGHQDFVLFMTGYIVEKSLSVDNLFVFLLIFKYFKTPGKYQHKVLFYGILGALIMRAIFIYAGIQLITKFTWVIYLFGAFLVYSGVKMLFTHEEDESLEGNKTIIWLQKFIPSTKNFHGHDFFAREGGKLVATPLFITLVFVEISDVIFAVDSIPAIIGITKDSFLVFTSNVFAILGLRSLYFALKGMADIFHYLKYGLSAILVFIGVKMLASHIYHIPVWLTITFISLCIALSILMSLLHRKD